MKNIIIFLLVLLSIFLLLQALDVFEFGSLIERDHRVRAEQRRQLAVQKSPTLKFAALYDRQDLPAVDAIKGVELAIELINKSGGIQGKQVTLLKRDDITDMTQHNAAVQELSQDFSCAAIIGPYSSGYIPAARSLTQYQGLPLISPLTVVSEKLPPLKPDNFVSFFPPLQLWTQAILQDMAQRKLKNLMIVSPATNTYGDIFCTALERACCQMSIFDRVYRINYQPPLSRNELSRAVRNYQGEYQNKVIFFGGTLSDFPEFIALVRELQLTCPIYGTDDLNVQAVKKYPTPGALFLPRVVLPQPPQEFMNYWRKKYSTAPGFNAVLGGETMRQIAQVFRQHRHYSPQRLVRLLRSDIERNLEQPQTAPQIRIEEIFKKK